MKLVNSYILNLAANLQVAWSETNSSPLQRQKASKEFPRQENKLSEVAPREQSEAEEQTGAERGPEKQTGAEKQIGAEENVAGEQSGPGKPSSTMPLEETDNTDFFYGSLFKDEIAIELDSDNEQAPDEMAKVKVVNVIPVLSLQEILSDLAKAVNVNKISKFNICRKDIWDGTKRGLSRKSFSPGNKISVRFSDDSGTSEGAVDLGGPTREFFTLVVEWLANSQLFCGPKEALFLSCNASCLANSEYLYAGKITALSLVHGGPGLWFFSPVLYDALIKGPDQVKVALQDIYDPELRTSLEELSGAQSVQEAYEVMSRNNLDTILELGGTLQPIKSTKDIDKIVQQTAHWYVLGRARPALEQFKQGLLDLGVLNAILSNPDVFYAAFCYIPAELNADSFRNLFTVLPSEEGSNKRAAENLIISYWHDYLQDAEEGETKITLSDLLFFTSGCKQLPLLRVGWDLSLEFLHDLDNDGNLSPFPKANTCGPVLQLPVVHKSYEAFKDAMTFAIRNSKGFGYA